MTARSLKRGQEGLGPWTGIWTQKGPSSSPRDGGRGAMAQRRPGAHMLGAMEGCLAGIILLEKASPSCSNGLVAQDAGTCPPGTGDSSTPS